MYRSSYAEVLEDSHADARREERRALDRAVLLLKRAKNAPPQSPAQLEAIAFVNQLWAFFIKSLASNDNDLPDQVRADLMSIGLGVMAEACRIEAGESDDFESLADICGMIRDGLSE
jgi:flagellar biosynthesis activator protein FlaF